MQLEEKLSEETNCVKQECQRGMCNNNGKLVHEGMEVATLQGHNGITGPCIPRSDPEAMHDQNCIRKARTVAVDESVNKGAVGASYMYDMRFRVFP